MADQLALPLDAKPPGTYRQRGRSSLQRLFRTHLPELLARYEAEFASRLGSFRRERITKAVERFLDRGDYTKGIARIRCTNPDGTPGFFRPVSFTVSHVVPPCSQKRTLLFGAYADERLLLRLPRRQTVFTHRSGRCTGFPRVLRHFFRHEHRLHGELSRLVHRMMQDACSGTAGPHHGGLDPQRLPPRHAGEDTCRILSSPRSLGSAHRPPGSSSCSCCSSMHSSLPRLRRRRGS